MSEGTDPIFSYAVSGHERPEVFETHVASTGHDVVRGVAAFGAITLVLWFVASLALWAVGVSALILISGVVAAFIAAVIGVGLSMGSDE